MPDDQLQPDYDLVPVDHDPFAVGPVAKPGQTIAPPTVGQDIASMPGKVANVAGDVTGVNDAISALRGQMTPDEAQNFALMSAAGLLTPEMRAAKVAMGAAEKVAPELTAAARAALPMDEASRMARAAQQGWTIDAFHGTGSQEFEAFDPMKVRDNIQYGGNFYFTPSAEFANKHTGAWSGDTPRVMPVKLKVQNPFRMDQPITAEQAAEVLKAAGRTEQAKKMIEGGPLKYWTGSTLFYHGLGQDTPVALKAQAIRDAGYDAIIGDPQKEITGTPGRPHIMVFEPSQVRSRFDSFDPANVGSDKLIHPLLSEVPQPQGIRAYHGSPYDFDKFDLSKIGTGEGAQAYGHGIYLAEHPSTAESYRTAGTAGNMPAPTYEAPSDVLASHAENFGKFAVSNPLLVKGFRSLDVESRSDVLPVMRGLLQDPEIGKAVVRLLPVDVMHMLGGKEFTSDALLNNPSMLVDLLPTNANNLVASRVKAVDMLAPYVALATAKRPLIGPQSTAMLEEALAARSADKGDLHVRSEIPYPSKAGNLYEVNINADPEHFLDWDKPLSEQSPAVQQKLKDAWLAHPEAHANQTGEQIYRNNEISLHTPGQGHTDVQRVAQQLRDAGIPGIKYLDQGSRATPTQLQALRTALEKAQARGDEGVIKNLQAQINSYENPTRNYVVFNDKLIDIIKKYGLAGLVAGGASHFQTVPVDYDPFAKTNTQGMAQGGSICAPDDHPESQSNAEWQMARQTADVDPSDPIGPRERIERADGGPAPDPYADFRPSTNVEDARSESTPQKLYDNFMMNVTGQKDNWISDISNELQGRPTVSQQEKAQARASGGRVLPQGLTAEFTGIPLNKWGVYDKDGELLSTGKTKDEAIENLTPKRAHGGRVEVRNIEKHPSKAQIAAGNYKKDHLHKFGLQITIENGKGGIRRGIDKDGRPWRSVLPAHYGYLKRHDGADGDNLDVFLCDHPRAKCVYIVDQVDADTKKFDEHKIILGAASLKHATNVYHRAFADGRGVDRVGAIHQMTLPDFKKWLEHGKTTKPFAHVENRKT